MNNLPPNHYTLEMIRQQRIDKKKEILQSKEQMLHLAHHKNKFEGMMQHVNMGIAAYDGLMTGIKVLRRIRAFFGSGKRKRY